MIFLNTENKVTEDAIIRVVRKDELADASQQRALKHCGLYA